VWAETWPHQVRIVCVLTNTELDLHGLMGDNDEQWCAGMTAVQTQHLTASLTRV